MKELFRNKTIWFYIGLGGSALALVTLIYYMIQSLADDAFMVSVLLLLIAGIACEILLLFKDFKFLPLLTASSYGVALAIIFSAALPTYSDLANGVNFIGGNAAAYTAYLILIGISAICAIVSNFNNQLKKN